MTQGVYRGGCYCGNSEGHERLRKRYGYPAGYCAFCSICGGPGHARHSPLPIPASESFCDQCYDMLASDYDTWAAEHPGKPIREFMDPWRELHPPVRVRGIWAKFIAWLKR